LVIALIPAAHAETYKWVDANGVVNYSNTPPSSGTVASRKQTVPDRISSYTPEPVVSQPIDVYRRLDATEAEWLQRQRIMAMQQAQAMAAQEPEPAYYPAGPYYPVRRPGLVRPVLFAPKPVPTMRPARSASLNRL
jgi:hypothetical protein